MEKRQNYSQKREAIYRAICSSACHPSAEWLLTTLKRDYPDLSLGTVYRNIARFKEQGAVVAVAVVNGQERIDTNVEPHMHFICRGCGAVLDIEGELADDASLAQIEQRYGLKVESQNLLLYGMCAECRK